MLGISTAVDERELDMGKEKERERESERENPANPREPHGFQGLHPPPRKSSLKPPAVVPYSAILSPSRLDISPFPSLLIAKTKHMLPIYHQDVLASNICWLNSLLFLHYAREAQHSFGISSTYIFTNTITHSRIHPSLYIAISVFIVIGPPEL